MRSSTSLSGITTPRPIGSPSRMAREPTRETGSARAAAGEAGAPAPGWSGPACGPVAGEGEPRRDIARHRLEALFADEVRDDRHGSAGGVRGRPGASSWDTDGQCGSRWWGTWSGSSSPRWSGCRAPGTSCTRRRSGRSRAGEARWRPFSWPSWPARPPSTRALGDDEIGHRAERELTDLGLRVKAVYRPEPQRRGFVHVDDRGERTITVIGERLGPRADDPLPWDELRDTDAVYLTAGDAGAVRLARQARVLVSAARNLEMLGEAGVELDALVASRADEGERYDRGAARPGAAGGGAHRGGRGRCLGARDGGDRHLGSHSATRAGARRVRVRRQLRRRPDLRTGRRASDSTRR